MPSPLASSSMAARDRHKANPQSSCFVSKGEGDSYALTFSNLTEEEIHEIHSCLYGGDMPTDMSEDLQTKLSEAANKAGIRDP